MTLKEMTSLGGKARAAAMSPERRKAIARKAAKARWDGLLARQAIALLGGKALAKKAIAKMAK